MNIQEVIPFLWVTDIEASIRFYVDGLGFTIAEKWIHEERLRWCRLQRGGVSLMLQAFWQEGPHANLPDSPLGVGVTTIFLCDDALAIYCEVAARGIRIDEPFVGNGMWVTETVDPDGHHLLFESPTDIPEETRYSVWAGERAP